VFICVDCIVYSIAWFGFMLCNIPGCETRNKEVIKVCIAFMHRKSGKFSRFQIKLVKVIEVSLEFMELK
jgi:hypothetical protein